MNNLKLHLSLELPNGVLIPIEGSSTLKNLPVSFDELEKTVSHLGHEILPLLEHKLLEQMSLTFVGEKNQE